MCCSWRETACHQVACAALQGPQSASCIQQSLAVHSPLCRTLSVSRLPPQHLELWRHRACPRGQALPGARSQVPLRQQVCRVAQQRHQVLRIRCASPVFAGLHCTGCCLQRSQVPAGPQCSLLLHNHIEAVVPGTGIADFMGQGPVTQALRHCVERSFLQC